jgi:Tol biopolymer transport system component
MCGRHPATGPAAAPPNAEAPAVVQFGAEANTQTIDPGNVNVFGEMKGVRPGPVRPVGDSNFQQHTFIDQGYDADVSVDPTGKWIIFASTRDSEHPNLYMQRTDGTAVTQLTNEAADDANPVFSPDGHQIAFASTRAGNWEIFTMDANGKNVTQVTTGPMQSIHPSWSPDGSRIVYCSLGSKSQQWELWTYNLQTNEKRMIGYGLFPSWSPARDADRIAFQRPRQRGSRWFSLWTVDVSNGEASRATEIVVSSNAAILSPTWSLDGKQIAFATVMEPAKDLPRGTKGRTDIWVVNVDGADRRRLTDGTGTNLMPFWFGDRVFFISDRGGAECVWSVRAESAKALPVAKKEVAPVQQDADVRDSDH